jgi:transposase
MKKTKRIEKTNTMRLIERVFDKDIEELLKELYTDQHKSIEEVAKILGVSTCITQKWLVKFEIPRRKITFI